MRRFVDAAHRLGIGVILDVVYNHIGPDGNYLKRFAEEYFTDQHTTDWGEAINFYDRGCGPVREFFIHNAGYWIDEFHLDGLRLDATQNIYDESADHVIAALTRQPAHGPKVGRSSSWRKTSRRRPSWFVRRKKGAMALDGLWNDDFHHAALVALTGHNEAYYSDYLGRAEELIRPLQIWLSVSRPMEPVAREAPRYPGARSAAVGVYYLSGKPRPGFEFAVAACECIS